MRLDKKVILITASTRGIGLACVQKCAAEGGIVYMAARNEKNANERAEELKAQGYEVHVVYHDAGIPESYKIMVEKVIKEKGRIDVLVNNFGTSDPAKDLNIETTSFRCNAVLPGMTEADAVKNSLTDDLKKLFLHHTPIRRMARPEEIASAWPLLYMVI